MASMVLWQAATHDGGNVTATWHKGNTFTVDHVGRANPVTHISPNLSPTRHYASKESAIRAAKRLAARLKAEG